MLGLLGVFALAAGLRAEEPVLDLGELVVSDAGDERLAVTVRDAPGEYWIGIVLGELPPIAKAQLGLEHGLVVEEVVPDSPAAKAGFKALDVIVKADEKVLKEPADILRAVDAAKEKEMTIVVVRGGEKADHQVTPIKRPPPEVLFTKTFPLKLDEQREQSIKQIEEALQRLKGKQGDRSLGLYFAHPGVVVNVPALQGGVPNNLTIRIMKDKGAPAKIYVKQEDQEWEVTEDKLDDLPARVRGPVERLLGKGPMAFRSTITAPRVTVRKGPPGYGDGPLMTPADPALSLLPQATRLHAYRVVEKQADGVEAKVDLILKKLDQMENKSIENLQNEVRQLRRELDELRAKSPGEK
ncbi:MAG: PDZ domain-containing protein [Pirellulaceae bacterium]